MIAAELHGKLSDDYSNAHERSEDLLTSTVFGLLRYLPANDGLLPMLCAVRVIEMVAGRWITTPSPDWIDTRNIERVEVLFWPSFGAHGQPDIILHLLDTLGAMRGIVLIEAKLYSPKSGTASDDVEVELV